MDKKQKKDQQSKRVKMRFVLATTHPGPDGRRSVELQAVQSGAPENTQAFGQTVSGKLTLDLHGNASSILNIDTRASQEYLVSIEPYPAPGDQAEADKADDEDEDEDDDSADQGKASETVGRSVGKPPVVKGHENKTPDKK